MTIAILGLGPSLKLFHPDYDYSIGVNDIWRFVKTNAVVCLDHRSKFNFDRGSIIDNCKPDKFYSQIVNYDTRPDFQLIKLASYYPDKFCNLDIPEINKSLCSPFVACGIAYKFYQAKEIHVFGVDLIQHPNLDLKMRERIKTHFINLKAALKEKGCQLVIHGDGILKNI
jgi:hypothetical protein